MLRSSWRRLIVAFSGIAILGGLAEVFFRFFIGLGSPPLSIADPQIEYLFAPNQTVHRFGHLVHYNTWSMRSDDFPAHKTRTDELRVMVLGDSVVNGGAQTDQSQLATAILQRNLSIRLGRTVVVGNISAGSWGPPNLLAYLRRFGLFDADVVAVVLSSHDYADAPTFEPVVGVHPDFPAHRPWCAAWEALTRYATRSLPGFVRGSNLAEPQSAPPKQRDIDWSISALLDIIRLAEDAGAKVVLAQHLELGELSAGRPAVGHAVIADAVRKVGIEPFDLEPAGTTAQLYRDNIHPNVNGQARMAARLQGPIEKALREKAAGSLRVP